MLKSRRRAASAAEPATSPWRSHTRLASARKSAHESVDTRLAMSDVWPDRYNEKRKEFLESFIKSVLFP